MLRAIVPGDLITTPSTMYGVGVVISKHEIKVPYNYRMVKIFWSKINEILDHKEEYIQLLQKTMNE